MESSIIKRKCSWDILRNRHQSSFTPASRTESMIALTFPWYFCSLFKNTETAGIPLSSRRSPRIFPILLAAATSRVDSMTGLSNFSFELAEAATVAVGVWTTWVLTYLLEKCILSTYGLRYMMILGGLTGGGITIIVVADNLKG
ncbi:unnamed protein product [Musa acuminata var. zebrina]